MTDYYELVPRCRDIPEAADFCLTLGDDCMLPYIAHGQRIYISCRARLEEMDAGLFLYEGRIICRQWCEDFTGALLLLCANPECESENLRIEAAARGKCLCLGKVLLDRKLPPPQYV